jgi:kynurenine formamidase
LSDTDPTWSGKPVFSHTLQHEGALLVGSFSTDEHFGTHVDAPAHFVPDGWTIDQIPVIRFVRPGVMIDLRAKCAKNEDYRVTKEDIVVFERRNGVIEPGTIVLVATGWDARWSDQAWYRNEHDGAMHFPGFSSEAATVLTEDRDVAALGIDTLSIDYGPSTAYEAHRHHAAAQGLQHRERRALGRSPADGFHRRRRAGQREGRQRGAGARACDRAVTDPSSGHMAPRVSNPSSTSSIRP